MFTDLIRKPFLFAHFEKQRELSSRLAKIGDLRLGLENSRLPFLQTRDCILPRSALRHFCFPQADVASSPILNLIGEVKVEIRAKRDVCRYLKLLGIDPLREEGGSTFLAQAIKVL